MSAAQEKIDRAKAFVMLGYPWWATLLLSLRTKESSAVPTMGTDGTWLLFNPKFTLSLTDKECQGVLLHEVAHCALLHPFRRKWRDPLLWNIAADAAANALLLADSIVLPSGCVPPADLKLTAEEIYDSLKDRVQKNHPQDVYGPGELGEDRKAEDAGATEEKVTPLQEKDWRDTLASVRGLEPGAISRTLDNSRLSQKDWKEELAEFMHATSTADTHTWNRLSRRVSGMPGWKRKPETTLVICIDTSGSVDASQLSTFMSEAVSISNIEGMSIHLISCDASVHQEIKPGEPWPAALMGGGGTSFVPALKKSESLEADAVIYFTDGEGEFPIDCSVPVLWALTKSCVVPFGKAIQIQKEN